MPSDARDLHSAALWGSGEDGMFSLIWAKDLITAAEAACLSFQPGAGPVQGVVLSGGLAPGALPILPRGFPAAAWGCQGRRTKCWRGKEGQDVPGLFRSGAEVGMWLVWAVPSGSLRLPIMWLRKACRSQVVAANSPLGSTKAAPELCDAGGWQQVGPFSGGCCSLLCTEMTQEQVR